MISFLKTRIAASLLSVATLSHPQICHAKPAQAKASVQLSHISIEKMGRGAPVILIPGLSSPREVWSGVASSIAKTHTVYLVQLNGFGESAPGDNLRPGIFEGVVADIDGFISSNNLKKPAVIGHSLGGLIGLQLAKTHAADIGKLMVVDSLPYIGDIFVPGATVAQVEPQARQMRDQLVGSYGKPANPAAAEAMANQLALKPDSRAKVAAWAKTADPRVTGEAMYEDMTTDLRPDMATIKTPITLVYPWSAQLPKVKADAFYRAEYSNTPNVTFVPIADSAHFVMLDQPEAFEEAVQSFLSK